ncbi:MAG: hypothetical protein H6737_11475 [Alphaproteobacteria bacterium]|nr:hypothetical protein [Alphaproteobacteria bacterium]
MAYNTRGSRPIVVDGMSFRWRRHDAEAELVVWHVLDAGVLTVAYLDPRFDPLPGFVARAVRMAFARGWRTDDHLRIELSPADLREADGFSSRSRTIALPGVESLLEHEAEVLEAPDPEGLSADAVLQVVFAPTFAPACIATLWAERDAGYAHLVGVVDGDRTEWLVEAEAEWIRDAIVSVRSAEVKGTGRIVLDGMPTRVTLRDPAGTWSDTDNAPEEGTPVRVATLAAWRIAMEAFGGVEDARDIVEALHPYVAPGVLPVHRDPAARVLRLYGDWTWPAPGEALVDVLRACRGPWIVDASRAAALPGLTQHAVRRYLAERDVPLFWIANEAQQVRWEHYEDRLSAEAARTRATRDAVRALVAHLDSRWQGVASEALLSRDPSRVEGAAHEARRWLDAGWAPSEVGPAEGWCFAAGAWDWREAPAAPGFVLDARQAWLLAPDGAVLHRPLTSRRGS